MRPEKYFMHLIQPLIGRHRTSEIFNYNPIAPPARVDAAEVKICVYNYDAEHIEEHELTHIEDTFQYRDNGQVTWLNVEGISKATVETICEHFGIHPLLVEDILSLGQRPKMDDMDGIMYCLLNMLYFNDHDCKVEQEQISIALGKDFVITFQEDAERDVFDGVRNKLKQQSAKLRQRGADYLCYSLLDMIVDHYFVVMEALGDKIEALEEEVVRTADKVAFAKLNSLRKEVMVLKRNVFPVRELINHFIRDDSELVEAQNQRYFRDIYDHIVQAHDVVESYREILTNLQDLYLSQVNLRLNEVMKVVAILTCLLAPATVIGGIFGMNFEIIPITHQKYGFYIAVALMILIPIYMIRVFRNKGWL